MEIIVKKNLFDKGIAVPVINDPNNIRYAYAEKNGLYFQTVHFPYKAVLNDVAEGESGTVKCLKSYVHARINRQGVSLWFDFHYQVETVERRKENELRRRSIVEKEKAFPMEADKAEIIKLVEPFLVELENVQGQKSAAQYIQFFQDWAYPPTLESVTAGLTEEQKQKAAKLLREYFAA